MSRSQRLSSRSQDHILVPVVYNTTALSGDRILYDQAFKAAQVQLWMSGQYSASLISAPNTGIGYLNLTDLYGADGATQHMADIRSSLNASTARVASTAPTVRAGYAATYDVQLNRILPSAVGSIEILQGNTGSWMRLNNSMVLQVRDFH